MWQTTGWCLATWARITVVLGAIVGVTYLVAGPAWDWFWPLVAGAALVELYTTRQLAREWAQEARYAWWWGR